MGTGQMGSVVERSATEADRQILGVAHRTLRKVTDDIERFHFNTAVAALMAFGNELQSYLRDGAEKETFAEAYRLMLLMLAPMAPHITHELWEATGRGSMLADEAWPEWDESLAAERTVTLVVQVNGKVRDRIEVDPGIGPDEAEGLALASSKVANWIEGGVKRIVSRPPSLVNIVTE
jgi:leucyl-tRNA synthetase